MSKPKIAIIGHVVPAPVSMPLSDHPMRAKMELQVFNYTRVVTEDDRLVDHIAYLKEKRDIPKDEAFSIWEMRLCAPLLLSSLLREHGFDVHVINYVDDHNQERMWAELKAFAPDIIAATTTFVLTPKQFMQLGETLREQFPNTTLIGGGHHVFTALERTDNAHAEQYLKDSQFDILIADPQGEQAILDIAQSYPGSLDHIPNLVMKSGEDVLCTERNREDNDVNMTLAEFLDTRPGDISNIRTARSCSFKCAFCSYPSVAGPLATLTLDNVRQSLQRAQDAELSALFFVDDTFNVPKDRFEEILDLMLEMEYSIPWYSFIRAQYITEEIVEKMKRTGCAGVYLGVESGSDEILKKMKKGAIIDFYKRGIAWLKKADILTVGSFIMGFPGETGQTARITQRFVEESGLDYYYIQPFYYLHHTPVHDRAEEYGLDGEGAFWSHNTMNSQEANAHVARMFFEIDDPVFINPDYTLWEVAYLRTKGMSLQEIKDYRIEINRLTREQMRRFGLYSDEDAPGTTSRSATA